MSAGVRVLIAAVFGIAIGFSAARIDIAVSPAAASAPAEASKAEASRMQSLGPALLDCRTSQRDTVCHYMGWRSKSCAAAHAAVTADGIFGEIREFNRRGGDEIALLLKVDAAIKECKR